MAENLEKAKKYCNLAGKNFKTFADAEKAIKYYKLSFSYMPKDKRFVSNLYSKVCVRLGVAYARIMNNSGAVSVYNKALSNEALNKSGKRAIYNNLGVLLGNRKSELLFKKSIKMSKNDSLPRLNLAKLYRSWGYNSKTKDLKVKYFKKSILVCRSLINKDKGNKVKYDIMLVRLSISIISLNYFFNREWLAKNINMDINPLFYCVTKDKKIHTNINEFGHNTQDKNVLISIFRTILYSLLYSENHLIPKSPKELLYQYTGINTLKSVCNVNKNFNQNNNKIKFKLRLYNTDYMNDPLEGKGLLKELIHINKTDKLHNVKDIINIIYANHNTKYSNLTSLHSSHVYIASLSYVKPYKDNSMSLWNSYSDNHKGISLGLDINIHRNLDTNDFISKGYNVSDSNSNRRNKIPLNLYRVSYDLNDISKIDQLKAKKQFLNKCKVISPNEDIKNKIIRKLHNVSSRIKDVLYLKNLDKVMNKIPKSLIQNDDNIFRIIELSLDRVRFLAKTGAFRYENECRLMEEIPDSTKTYYDRGNEKLFIELNPKYSSVTATLKSIIFGNRCKSYYWLPIVEKQLYNVKTFKSNIKYR